MGVLENECKEVNKRFFTSHAKQQPYIILKWAETANGIMGHCNGKRLTISNEYTNRLVHKWRSEEMAILVGTNTALQDDPILTNRYWPGPSPIRIVLDRNLRLPKTLQIFQGQKTIVLTDSINETRDTVRYIKLSEGISVPHQLANTLFQQNIQSVLIEGGAQLLQSFIDSELWNEARVIINKELFVENGVAAPTLQHAVLAGQQTLFSDNISFYKKHS